MNVFQNAAWTALRSVRGPHLIRSFRVSAEEEGAEPSEPFVLLANHSHRLDPYVIASYLKRPVRYMANLEGVSALSRIVAPIVGAYGKRKGMEDLRALKDTLRYFRQGDSIGIFPEGDRSWDGESAPLRPGIEKLLKKLGAPLRLVRQVGNYLSGPRWAERGRRGRYLLFFRTLDAEFVRESDSEELRRAISDFLYGNDLKAAELADTEYVCTSPADGVERLLWLCPACGSVDTMAGRGDRISCRACGARWAVDARQRVVRLGSSATDAAGIPPFGDLKDWSDWQRSRLDSIIADAAPDGAGRPAFSSRGVRLAVKDGTRIRRLGTGTLSLFRNLLSFDPDAADGQPLGLDPRRVRGFVDNFNEFQAFSHRGDRYRLELGGSNALKWEDAFRSWKGLPA